MLDNNNNNIQNYDDTTTHPISASCGVGNPMAGQMALEDILRSGDNPLAEEFIELCATLLHPPSMGY